MPGDERGVVLVEFAIIFPVLLLVIFAVMEFGWYFIRLEAVNHAVSITAAAIANGTATTQADAELKASGAVQFGTGGNYICAQAYSTNAAALAANPYCTSSSWSLGSSSTPYVAIVAYAAPMALSGFINQILPSSVQNPTPTAITVRAIQPVGGNTGGAPPTCTAGQTLTWSTTANAFQCSNDNVASGEISGGCTNTNVYEGSVIGGSTSPNYFNAGNDQLGKVSNAGNFGWGDAGSNWDNGGFATYYNGNRGGNGGDCVNSLHVNGTTYLFGVYCNSNDYTLSYTSILDSNTNYTPFSFICIRQ
jgi:Flp pilus assembly protein TadG